MKILVFDSEIQSYHLICNILADYDERYDVIGPFSSIEQCKDYLLRHKDVDLVITEVILGNDTIFDALDLLSSHTPVIFATSHSEYALQAFNYYSLSYLIKPIDEVALVKALAKAARLRKVSPMLTPRGSWANKGEEHSRIVVRTFNGERVIHVSTIRYIVSEQKNTYIIVLDGNSYRIDKTLEQLSFELDTERFMRVNRKYIVPIEQILGTERKENGKLKLLLRGAKSPDIIVSRTRKSEVCEWLKGR